MDEHEVEVPKTFCILPWMHLEFEPNGIAKICCMAEDNLWEDGRPLSLNEHTVAHIWGSSALNDVRQKMLAGTPLKACQFCYRNEETGGLSFRNQMNSQFVGREEQIAAEYQIRLAEKNRPSSGAEGWPTYFHLILGNQCNLSCRMCSAEFSSKIAQDKVQSKWAGYTDTSPRVAVWEGDVAVIGPEDCIGVRQTGFLPLSQRDGQMFRLSFGLTGFEFNVPSGEVIESIGFELWGVHPAGLKGEVILNGQRVWKGEIPEGEWSPEFPLQLDDMHHGPVRLAVRSDTWNAAGVLEGLERTVGLAFKKIKLRRSKKSRRRNQALWSRFSSPQPWYKQASLLFGEVLRDPNSLRQLNITGGEPFLSPEFKRMVAFLVDSGAANSTTLNVVTNGTIVDHELLAAFEHFDKAQVCISLDGIGPSYEYIRYPAQWGKIEQNVLEFQKFPHIFLSTSLCVQLYNVLHLAEYLRWNDLHGIHGTFQPLHGPAYLAVGVAPPQVRALSCSQLGEYRVEDLPDGSSKTAWNLGMADYMIEFVGNQPVQCEQRVLDDFAEFTNDLDLSRGQSFEKTHATLFDMFVENGLKWSPTTRYHQAE